MAERDRSDDTRERAPAPGDWRRGYDETVRHGPPMDTEVSVGDYHPGRDQLTGAGVRGYGSGEQWGSGGVGRMSGCGIRDRQIHRTDEPFSSPPPDVGAPGGWGRMGGWHQSGTGAQRRSGPKGYKRSDDRIREDPCEHLMDISEIDSSDGEIRVQDGHVTLEGTVPERSMRYLIEDIAAQTSGVTDVDNNIRVPRPRINEDRTSGDAR